MRLQLIVALARDPEGARAPSLQPHRAKRLDAAGFTPRGVRFAHSWVIALRRTARTLRRLCFASLCPLVACGVALVLFAAPRVQADDATGTWTGSLEGRGNYYWERSTRVVVPAAKIKLAAPNGLRVGADYLVDVITSASIAQT